MAGVLVTGLANAGPARAATTGPCDIYASGGTPCVAAHSTTRALYGSYNGVLYQVRRASDNATGRGTINGTKAIIWPCNGQTNQQWTLG